MAFAARWRATGAPLYLSTAAGALALSLAGEENHSFDGEGRLVGAWQNRITYRRALDNRILAKWLDPARPARRLRRFLEAGERRALLESVYARAAAVREGLDAGALELPRAADPADVAGVRAWLERVAKWDWARLEAEAARFAAVYKPIPILPPDQYLSLVVQPTEGCSYNECSFCTFYRDRPFRIKTLAAFEQHVEGVLRFVGRGIALRRGLFLADANAVVIAQERLLPMLELLRARVPALAERIFAFVSAPDALRKSPADFAALRARGLRRVYVGVETGHDPLRAFLRKQGTAADVRRAVESIKAGGVAVGLILMVGIGGEPFRDAQRAGSVALLETLPLDAQDIIYLSPFVSEGDSPYDADMRALEAATGLPALDEEAIRAEEERFKRALQPLARRTGARISHYDLREFVY